MWDRKWSLLALAIGVLGLAGLAAALSPRTVHPEQVLGLRQDERPRPASRLTSADVRTEEKAIRDAAASFSAAMNKGDLEAMLGHWSPDGEYISESGKVYRGKAQLRTALKKAIANTRGAKHTAAPTSIRFLKPDVAQEEGSIFLSTPDGQEDRGPYAALWLKVDGRWLLASVRDLPGTVEEGKPLAYTHLRPLAWLVGDWQEKNGEATLSVRWAPGSAYLLMDWTVKRADEVLTVHQRIGWDPINSRVRSWVYDSNGGFGEAAWQREGNRWVVTNEGTTADGKVARSLNSWKYLTKDSVQWTATERDVDDAPMPDAEAVYVRKVPAEGGAAK
ncbi:MAG: SgcJ/EcaC family oxidoreductase [Gemmataceae bacterium]